ncbi:P-loop containing nucleoside triphosphate hydrolase [Pseudocohnilembus persalinus]|uniref:p-loop containing nucleoside triphosphate hydrolase n=1 Tax=Pseudocohnilembus persalinus TaxID=266149 RepID=A0A0V0R7V8_PSEPJ|nr:P-loop containing nucleoside triphosphate hydrolase [Pseudocohnilembus persalinus]|eukprot:KRX10410.1 P-loop containing nucleoside triphosphate hydrolase [Pseudocohnilembus persalinus]
MAAISVAKRVSFELGLQIGKEIGYSVRFDQKHSDQTCVKYLTDGMLINEILADPLLQNYSIIMVDDIHERSMNTDLILGMLKKIRNKRKDLKLIVSSATLDAEKVEKFFKDDKFPSKILCVEGRKYDVDTFYLNNPCQNYVVQALQLAVTLHKEKNEGDVLIFLTSQEEIEVFIQMMEDLAQQDLELQNIILLPLYATLPLAQQMEVFKPSEFNQRKIIVATNIAESSITIDGIVYVIDSMFYKTKHYDYKKGYDQLVTIPISRSSADQRLGRAGRVSKGESFEYLNSLQIIDDNGELTKKGEQVCELPLDTKTAVMIINSFDDEFQSSKEILILAAMISIQGSLFFTNQEPPELLSLHPYSLLTIAPPKYVVYKEIIKTNKLYIRECSEIDESWILELAGHFYTDVRQQIANQRHEAEIKEHMKEEKKQESLKVQEQIETQKNLFVKKKISKDNNKGKLSFIKQKPKNQQGKNDIKKVKTNILSFGDDEDENM